jgi:hypothetical protein
LAFWSNDSRFFAFDATVGPAGGAGSHILTVSSVSGGEPREFRLPSAYVRSITWMPNNTALVLRVPDDKGRGMLQRLDLKTGKLTTFGSLEHVPRNWLVLARDGRSFYYIVTDMPGPAKGAVARIMVQEAATGKERVAYEAPKGEVIFGAFSYIPRFCLTPDGRSLIVPLSDDHAERATRVRLVLVNIADGTTRDLFVPAPGDSLPIMLPVQLSPDGRGVDVVRSKTSAGADRKAGWYWRVPLAGGSPQLLGPQSDDPEMVLDAGTPHSPDGRRVAFLKGKHAEELWVLRDDALRADTKPSGSSRR